MWSSASQLSGNAARGSGQMDEHAKTTGGWRLRSVACAVMLLCVLALVGCGDDRVDADVSCAEAESHMEMCGENSEAIFADGCDPVLAAELLNTDCATFQDPGKSDAIGNLLCRAGFYRSCKVPVCETALPAEFHDWGDCSELIDQEGCGACDYYRCREETSIGMCGDQGYYLGFGHAYCLRYRLVTEPHLSLRGQAWSARSRRCLIETLDSEVPDSVDCPALIEAGYASHPTCYLGTGFCDLPAIDWLRIANTIDLADADFALIAEIANDCFLSQD